MSQTIWTTINPDTTSGTMLATILTDFKDALMSGISGTSRPAELQAGGMWIDTTNQSAPTYYWSFKMYNGSTDYEIFRLSVLDGFGGTVFADGTFEVDYFHADTTGALLELAKKRLDSNGQVLTSDVVLEIRFTGRTDTSTDPNVAYLRFTASDDMTTSAYGGTFSLYSTPDAQATATEHMRLIAGLLETVVAHKVNSLQLVSQNIATTATIAALDASDVLAEMTGSTATDIQGIDATKNSKTLNIHNRSSANVTLKHENTSASATNRLKLPSSIDVVLFPDTTAQLYYCTTDSRWKMVGSFKQKLTQVVSQYMGLSNSWTAPTGVTKVNVWGQYRCRPLVANCHGSGGLLVDPFNNLWCWGANAGNELPLGDTVARSSPVAALGALKFRPFPLIMGESEGGTGYSVMGLTTGGDLYAWGQQLHGQLGIGSVATTTSPVAVLGGIKFSAFYPAVNTPATNGVSSFALTRNFKMFSWGGNANGQLGLGDVTPRSSPVAVLGALKIATFDPYSNTLLTTAGAAYYIGANAGAGGLGDQTPRSSPVAVLGGLTFNKVAGTYTDATFSQQTSGTVYGLTTAGAMYAWGRDNSAGQFGDGTRVAKSSPVAVIGGLTFTNFWPVAAGCLAITAAGTLYAWGYNDDGSGDGVLGLGDAIPRSSPVAVSGGLTFLPETIVAHALAIFGKATNGNWYYWGEGAAGGAFIWTKNVPTLIGNTSGAPSNVEYFAGNNSQFFASCADGMIYGASGSNSKGQIGNGSSGVSAGTNPASITQQTIGGIAPASPIRFGPIPVTVTPGQSYPIFLSHSQCYFGDTPLDEDMEFLWVEYHK